MVGSVLDDNTNNELNQAKHQDNVNNTEKTMKSELEKQR